MLVSQELQGLEMPSLKKKRGEEGKEFDIRGHSRRYSNQANTDTEICTQTLFEALIQHKHVFPCCLFFVVAEKAWLKGTYFFPAGCHWQIHVRTQTSTSKFPIPSRLPGLFHEAIGESEI
jgi:hypothetical protein